MSKIVEGSYPPESSRTGPSSQAGAPTPVGKVRPVLTIVPGESGSGDERAAGGSSALVDEIVREGARRMLAEALQAEVEVSSPGFDGGSVLTLRRVSERWCGRDAWPRTRPVAPGRA